MTIEVSCGACHFQFRVQPQYAGKLIRCPECRLAVSVPVAKAPERTQKAPGRRSQPLPAVRASGVHPSVPAPARAVRHSQEAPRSRSASRYTQSGPARTVVFTALAVVGIGLLGLAAYRIGQSQTVSPDLADVPSKDVVAQSTSTDTTGQGAQSPTGPSGRDGNPATSDSAGAEPGRQNSAFAGVPVIAPETGYPPSPAATHSTSGDAVSGVSSGPGMNAGTDAHPAFAEASEVPPGFAGAGPSGLPAGSTTSTSVAAPDISRPRPQESQTPPSELNLADLIEQVQPSVVRIDVNSIEGDGHGSGFVIDTSGIVVTNYHVVEGGTKGTVHFKNGDAVPVEGCLFLNGRKDIAILKIDPARCSAPLTALSLSADTPRQGVAVAALGAPYGLDFTVTAGIISAVRDSEFLKKSIGFSDHEGTWIQTTAPISPGNSGGPLVDRLGNVVAINTITMVVGQNLNFGISAEDIRQGMQQLSSTPTPLSPQSAPVRGHVSEPAERGALVDAINTERGRELMRSLKTFRIVKLTRSYDVLGTVTSAVDREAREALEKAGLRESVAASATLILVVNQRTAGNGSRLLISSQLVVEQRLAGQEQLVMIWERSEDVGAISDQALFQGTLPSALKKEISTFFRSLRAEISAARRDADASASNE